MCLCSGPAGLQLQDADRAVAMATGLRGGRYTFRLTVSDQEEATDSALLSVRVQEGGFWFCWYRLICRASDQNRCPSSRSQQSSSRRPRQRQPCSGSAQQLCGSEGVRNRRTPDRGPVPVDQRQPESCSRGSDLRLQVNADTRSAQVTYRFSVLRRFCSAQKPGRPCTCRTWWKEPTCSG